MFATDSTNAAYTFLMNIGTLEWDKTLLRFFGISAGCLPEIKTSSEVYGKIADGPLAGVRVSGVLGNRQAALVGHRCFRRGLAKATLAGSGTAFVVTGPDRVFSGNGLLTTVGYQLDASPVYALEGPIASAGGSIEWTKRCLDVRENECSTAAEHGRDTLNSVYLVPAFAGEQRVSPSEIVSPVHYYYRRNDPFSIRRGKRGPHRHTTVSTRIIKTQILPTHWRAPQDVRGPAVDGPQKPRYLKIDTYVASTNAFVGSPVSYAQYVRTSKR